MGQIPPLRILKACKWQANTVRHPRAAHPTKLLRFILYSASRVLYSILSMTDDGNKAVKQARLFAEALQLEDYQAARDLLAPECVYFQLARDLKGPKAVIDSYKQGAKWGIDQFDSVERESSVKPTEDGRALLTFFYKIRHKGKSLRFRSEQIIELDAAGLIGRIEHIELASQANALFKFYFETGIISKSGDGS
ncbi:hypothetical protein ACFL5Z_18225 [Planctomycetota bacterium]